MLYIHKAASISPQETIQHQSFETICEAVDGKLIAKEPAYQGIPSGILRRMGKAVRMGVGAALQLISKEHLQDGIIIGTANGGMEDCMKFLKQIIEYDEGVLTPGSFVQGIPNAIAGQLGLLTGNKGYNITHVHRGLAFENSLTDAWMQLKDFPANSYLVGAVDEISNYNYNIEFLNGNYKKENITPKDFYQPGSAGSIAGEGATMFLFSGKRSGALAQVKAIDSIHTTTVEQVKKRMNDFLAKNLQSGETIDVLITGENGDSRLLKYYEAIEGMVGKDLPVARFKHLCGEYSTASAYALWLIVELLKNQHIPVNLLKSGNSPTQLNRILYYNNYVGEQHSFVLVENVNEL